MVQNQGTNPRLLAGGERSWLLSVGRTAAQCCVNGGARLTSPCSTRGAQRGTSVGVMLLKLLFVDSKAVHLVGVLVILVRQDRCGRPTTRAQLRETATDPNVDD